jgi:hypothetical protein
LAREGGAVARKVVYTTLAVLVEMGWPPGDFTGSCDEFEYKASYLCGLVNDARLSQN